MTPKPPPWERALRRQGRVHLTGLQALVRLPLEQIRRDRAAGLRVGGIVSGYPGSPLAGLDRTFEAVSELCSEHELRLLPALNEELAVSAVAGSQLLDLFPHSRFDGAIGLWYGKAPGVDRSLDALRHSNFAGTSRHGGVLAVAGDDPACKSSSLPSRSDAAFRHAHIPLLAPGDAGEVLELGLHGFALSRFSGLWVGMKIVTDVADGGSILELPESRPPPVLPKFEFQGRPFEHRVDARLLPPQVQRIETRLLLGRLEAARRYAHANGLDRIVESRSRDRIGVVAVGRLFRELVSALELLGLDAHAREECGVRLYHLRMLYPLDERRLLHFASGLEEILVLDDRPGVVEDAIRAVLCNAIDPPRVLGQRGARGEPWLALHSDLDPATIAATFGPQLATGLGRRQVGVRAEKLRIASDRESPAALRRIPQFCSGCPHSTSTRIPEGSLAGGGIGCHTMALWMDRGVRFVGAMGSEGAHWIGLSPFVDTGHLFQNLGDGTYFHSGRQALRAAVCSGVSITYKLLHNGSVAMTGGQNAVGARPVEAIARELLADGVRRIVAVSDDPDLRALAATRDDVECIQRCDYDDAMQSLAREAGVSVLLYDALCANQKQKLERRGLRTPSSERIAIHRDVCEGCGDCGRRSSCASLYPVATPLGRKTRVHDSSCSDDRSCLEGDCPAFIALPRAPVAIALDEALLGNLPPASPCAWDGERFEIGLIGVGSTGVVTLSAILMRAAELDGLWALHLDQTGLAQRGGKVRSHCILSRQPVAGSPRVGVERMDTLLAFDLIGACEPSSRPSLSRHRTRAFACSDLTATAEAIVRSDLAPLEAPPLIEHLAERVRRLASLPAESLATHVMAEARAANVLLLGWAHQQGALPLSTSALERGIRDVGVAVESTLRAFRMGRAIAADPSLESHWLRDAIAPSAGAPRDPEPARRRLAPAWENLEQSCVGFESADVAADLLRTLAGLALDLADYQSRRWARRFLATLTGVARAEAACTGASGALTRIAARELYRLMAYKDEYEVARLLLRGPYRRWLERVSGGGVRRYFLMPPLLRFLGLRRKLALGSGVEPGLRLLVALRCVRGTPLDPFGHTRVRRLERGAIAWYEAVLVEVTRDLSAETFGRALEIAAAPSEIRGFESLKLARLERVQARVRSLLGDRRIGDPRA